MVRSFLSEIFMIFLQKNLDVLYFLHLYEKLLWMLPIQNVTYTKCYLYKMLPILNVTYTKCYLYQMLLYENVQGKMLLYENVLYVTLLIQEYNLYLQFKLVVWGKISSKRMTRSRNFETIICCVKNCILSAN